MSSEKNKVFVEQSGDSNF